MAAKTYVVYYINLKESTGEKGGGKSNLATTKFAWRAPADAYPKDIAKELGVAEAKDKEAGLIFGMNNPRPLRVRINVKAKQGSSKSVLLFCDPTKYPHLTIGNALRGKGFKGGTITTVSAPKTSTNPNRSSGGSKSTATKKPATKKPATKKPAAKKR